MLPNRYLQPRAESTPLQCPFALTELGRSVTGRLTDSTHGPGQLGRCDKDLRRRPQSDAHAFRRRSHSPRSRRTASGAINSHKAAEATRALKRLVDGLDPDHVGRVIGELVAAARSANDKKGRLRVVGFLASLVREVGRALKGVAEGVEWRDVVVVLLVVLVTAPELLVAAGVSAAVVRVLTPLLEVLVEVLPDRGSGPTSRRVPQSST